MKLNFMNNKLKFFKLNYDFWALYKFIFMNNIYFNNDREDK
jgi:hypothetical protein